MGEYNRKKTLYEKIEQLRKNLGIGDDSYPIDMVDFCLEKGFVEIGTAPFKSIGTRGMAVPYYERGEKDVILLNSHLSKREQSFTCGHELVHLTLHRSKTIQYFSFEQVMLKHNPFLEWQANEGSAELHVPYRLFFPRIEAALQKMESMQEILNLRAILAEEFQVMEEVIYYRFESLKYEIYQYLTGVSLDDINFMPVSKQREAGIFVESINEIESEIQKNPPLLAATKKSGHHQQG
jgi:Zn-dependent peptidase ImmA (M78 family)